MEVGDEIRVAPVGVENAGVMMVGGGVGEDDLNAESLGSHGEAVDKGVVGFAVRTEEKAAFRAATRDHVGAAGEGNLRACLKSRPPQRRTVCRDFRCQPFLRSSPLSPAHGPDHSLSLEPFQTPSRFQGGQVPDDVQVKDCWQSISTSEATEQLPDSP